MVRPDMNILVTGAFGYLGGRLVHQLLRGGEHALVLGSRRPRARISPSTRSAVTDWADPASLEKACAGVDAVVHLAGMNADDCESSPPSALEANGVATARLVEVAGRTGVDRLVYVSSAHVYGPLTGVVTEHTCPRPRHPYATSQRAGEDAVLGAGAGGVRGVVARLSNAYGPPVGPDTGCWSLVVNELCRQAAEDRRLVLKSSGRQRRDFVATEDACRAIEFLATAPSEALGSEEVFNIGGGWAPTIRELADFIAERAGMLFGWTCPVIVAEEAAPAPVGAFEYRSEALRRIGFSERTRPAAAIDALLRHCEERFAPRPTAS